MDPPPLPPSSPLPAAAAANNIPLINYPPPDSVHSSPRRHQQSTQPPPDAVNDGAVLPRVPGAKLRLMCSYGGHIIPRPHDKSLCYVGGETRIVAVERNSTVASLSARLSRTLPLNGRPFTLKYQLPNEDLDSLVSVATDEDLENLIEEYDRITGASSSSPRIRLFLFFSKPVTAASMGDLKSESWFFDALNSGSGAGSDSVLMLLPRNLSDTATMDGRVVPGLVDNIGGGGGDHYNLNQHHHHHQDSPIVFENFNAAASNATTTTTGPPSSGSSCSTSPSGMTNLLPPIRVRTPVDSDLQGFEQGARGPAAAAVVMDQDQFGYHQQLGSVQIQLDSISISSAAAAAPSPPAAASIAPAGGSSEHLNRVSSEDDDDTRSDPGRAAGGGVGFRKPPLPIPLPHQYTHQHQQQHKLAAFNNLPPSPDSVARYLVGYTNLCYYRMLIRMWDINQRIAKRRP
ncbi:unnamed protein product [Linum tenue]|uniref:PB1 domain-containing protein n=1 Tax=Linum tenue TaxID=586396 RepID=A0AAV0IFU3_9ROSI|nr:unnamed protein product [Linum tenue]